MSKTATCAGLLALLLAQPAHAQTVVDGDTLKLDGTIYRLWGIDAPEIGQHCTDGWAAGAEATRYLRSILSNHKITCENKGSDRYGRTIGLCRADHSDIQADMVTAGMAWAFNRYSHDYVTNETNARANRRGVHGHDCIPAWEYRARQKH